MNRLPMLMILSWLIVTATASAEYVLPQMGGGQVGQGAAGMKHADITFDGASLAVHVDENVGTPHLRALADPDEFDPAQSWSILNDKAYNFQYGWNPGGFFSLPSGSWIWIEQLSATPGLEVYFRPGSEPEPRYELYEPILGTADSSARWWWSGAMTHNVYAVLDPLHDRYEANYRVYLGDDITGEPLPAYGSAEVTFQFLATPILPGDFNADGIVDAADYPVWRDGLGTQFMASDYDVWKRHFGQAVAGEGSAASGSAVPEPSGLAVLGGIVVASLMIPGRTRQPCLQRKH